MLGFIQNILLCGSDNDSIHSRLLPWLFPMPYKVFGLECDGTNRRKDSKNSSKTNHQPHPNKNPSHQNRAQKRPKKGQKVVASPPHLLPRPLLKAVSNPISPSSSRTPQSREDSAAATATSSVTRPWRPSAPALCSSFSSPTR